MIEEFKSNSLIFPLGNKDIVKGYYTYLGIRSFYEKIDRLVNLGILIQEDDGFRLKVETNDYIITFIKVWYELERNLSAEFLYYAIQRCRLNIDMGLEPIFNVDRIWSIIRKDRKINKKHKNNTITELVSKGLIKRTNNNNYKVYMLDINNYELFVFIRYVYENILS